jgi:DNA-binding NtrC family response regulator
VEPHKLRVLVVDDEDLCRWASHQLLARSGHDVEEAASGEAALGVVEHWTPDAILVDIGLPGMDGIEFLRRVRRQQPLVRSIVMTAHATLQTAVAAIRAGAVDFLVKPLDPAELESALARVNVRRPEGQAHQAA